MNVLMITTTYPRFEGDTAAPFIASIAEGMVSLGCFVDMVLPYHPKLEAGERRGVRLHPYRVPGDEREPLWGYAQSLEADVRLKRKVLLLAPWAMHNTYRKALDVSALSRPDLIHAHWVLPNGFVGMRLARKLGKPLVVSLHGSDMFLARKNAVYRRFAARTLKAAAAVTACSPDLQEQAQEISGRSVVLMEYGVETGLFRPDEGRPAQGQSVFAVGRLVHKKGFLFLLDAFARVHPYYPDSILTIAGDGPLLAQLQERTQALGLSKFVTFPGNVDRTRLPDAFRRAAVVSVPSVTDDYGNRDGLPNVLLEAMSSGCAVVASSLPGIQNVMRDCQEGIVVPEGSVDSLAAALHMLLKDSELRARLSRNARQKAVADLSWGVKSLQLESLYRSVLRLPARESETETP